MYYLSITGLNMNITKSILKNKFLEIIADDKTIVNNQTLKKLVKKNSYVLSQFNIKKNDNVAIILNNSVDFVVSFLSTINICISAPLNPSYTDGEFDFYFQDLKPKAIISNFQENHPAIICAKKSNIKIIGINNNIFQKPLKNIK